MGGLAPKLQFALAPKLQFGSVQSSKLRFLHPSCANRRTALQSRPEYHAGAYWLAAFDPNGVAVNSQG
jgi:hypothetical protein